MLSTVIFLTLVPAIVLCSDGNIRLLEDEVIVALKACTYPNDNANPKQVNSERQRRSENSYDTSARIDDDSNQSIWQENPNSGSRDQIEVLDTAYTTDSEDGSEDKEENSESGQRSTTTGDYNGYTTSRVKRSDPLLNRPDTDQCLSQCVFANLQVVDSRGIPREAELWNKVQDSVTSQQSRLALRDQIRACFQELQSEAEDNGCSYSNKLERCLMLRFADRKAAKQGTTQKPSTGP